MKTLHFVGEWFDCCAPRSLLIDPQSILLHSMAHVACRHRPIRYEHFTATALDAVISAMTGKGIHVVLCAFPRRAAVVADLFIDQVDPAEVNAAMQVLEDLRDGFRPLRALLHRVQRDGLAPPLQGRAPRKPTEVLLAKPMRRAI